MPQQRPANLPEAGALRPDHRRHLFVVVGLTVVVIAAVAGWWLWSSEPQRPGVPPPQMVKAKALPVALAGSWAYMALGISVVVVALLVSILVLLVQVLLANRDLLQMTAAGKSSDPGSLDAYAPRPPPVVAVHDQTLESLAVRLDKFDLDLTRTLENLTKRVEAALATAPPGRDREVSGHAVEQARTGGVERTRGNSRGEVAAQPEPSASDSRLLALARQCLERITNTESELRQFVERDGEFRLVGVEPRTGARPAVMIVEFAGGLYALPNTTAWKDLAATGWFDGIPTPVAWSSVIGVARAAILRRQGGTFALLGERGVLEMAS